MKTCTSLDCPERKSVCCGAKSVIRHRDMQEIVDVCERCFKPFTPNPCTAQVGSVREKECINKIYNEDCFDLMKRLESESIDLIYIDPPFFTQKKQKKGIAEYNDSWENIWHYLHYLCIRLWEMKRVLKQTGSIYVHCDWHASHYIKTEMDKIFGYDHFIANINWRYAWGMRTDSKWNRKHDDILMYSKSKNIIFNARDVLEKEQMNWGESRMELFLEDPRRKMLFLHSQLIIGMSQQSIQCPMSALVTRLKNQKLFSNELSKPAPMKAMLLQIFLWVVARR